MGIALVEVDEKWTIAFGDTEAVSCRPQQELFKMFFSDKRMQNYLGSAAEDACCEVKKP